MRSRPRIPVVAALLLAPLGAACKGPSSGPLQVPLPPDEANFSYAVYDDTDALLDTPIVPLEHEIADRARRGAPPISDIYVLVHGWDFTVEEAFALYEGYRNTIRWRLPEIQKFDPSYQPWFVFVIWSSVTRPLTNALRSVLPFPPPDLVEGAATVVDRVVFHVPSAWGESQDAVRLAIGPPLRWTSVELGRDGHAEYREALERGAARVDGGGFRGFEIPVSLLLEELMHVADAHVDPAPRPSLHVVGHSFGGKLASLAAYDAVQRTTARELARGGPIRCDPLIDSLILILPAMQASEMYSEVPLELPPERVDELGSSLRRLPLSDDVALRFEAAAARIGTKVLIHSKEDSANGWVYGLGDLLLDHDAAARAQRMLAREQERPLPPKRTFGQRLITFPFDVADRTLQVVARGAAIVLQTAASDVGAVADGLVESGEEIVRDSDEPAAVLIDLLKVPFAPLYTQRSIGNRGFTRPRSLLSRLDPRTWLDAGAAQWLEGSQRIDADDLLALSVTLGTPPCSEEGRYFVGDARKLYTGPLGGRVSELIPPGAHGDLRSSTIVVGPGPVALSKRERTLNLVYNLTRGPKLARGPGHPAPSP